MDTLEGMRVFARVVDAGSFSEAARRLGISKALASKYVGQLEQRLGIRLLNRTTRKLTPTELGLAYYYRCARIVGEVEELEGSLRIGHASPCGHLRIAGPRIFGEDALVGCVTAFLEKHPAVTVDLVLGSARSTSSPRASISRFGSASLRIRAWWRAGSRLIATCCARRPTTSRGPARRRHRMPWPGTSAS